MAPKKEMLPFLGIAPVGAGAGLRVMAFESFRKFLNRLKAAGFNGRELAAPAFVPVLRVST